MINNVYCVVSRVLLRVFMLFEIVALTLMVTKVFCVAARVLLTGCYHVLSGC